MLLEITDASTVLLVAGGQLVRKLQRKCYHEGSKKMFTSCLKHHLSILVEYRNGIDGVKVNTIQVAFAEGSNYSSCICRRLLPADECSGRLC